MDRWILHCDMNNCYASIEVKNNPQYRHKPLAVCGSKENRHGIVLAKSQEAKILGVKTGEAIWEAQTKCPDLLVVEPHYEEYLKHSRWARQIYYQYTNQVESFGLDEAWLDVTGSTKLFGNPVDIADEIRNRMKKELGISISVGVSFNKIFAKLGSDMKKPDATTLIEKERFKEKVWCLGVRAMIGIGSATEKKLNKINVYSLGDLANANPATLKRLLGINGIKLWRYANGQDESVVKDINFEDEIKTIGNGITCKADLVNEGEVYNVFQALGLKVTKRLIEGGFKARGVQIHIRDSDLFTQSYQGQLSYPSSSSIILVDKAMDLFRKNYDWKKTVRAVSIRAIRLISDKASVQLDLFSDFEKYEKSESIDRTIYELRKKYGEDIIGFGGLVGDIKLPDNMTDIVTLPNNHANKNIDLN